jgi:hypothetical protein
MSIEAASPAKIKPRTFTLHARLLRETCRSDGNAVHHIGAYLALLAVMRDSDVSDKRTARPGRTVVSSTFGRALCEPKHYRESSPETQPQGVGEATVWKVFNLSVTSHLFSDLYIVGSWKEHGSNSLRL